MRYTATILLSFSIVFNIHSQILDLDFGDNGISLLDKYEEPGYEMFPVLDASGQMILAGLPSPSFMNSKVFVTRLNVDGSVDDNFGVDGYAEYDLGQGFVSITDFIQLDNGNLVVAGTAFQDGWLVMFDSEGSLVTDFGVNGFFDTQISADVNRVLVTQVNNRIFAVHKGRIGGSAHLATSYYNMDGTYDTSYGSNGTIVYQNLKFNSLNHVNWDYSSNGTFNGAYFSGSAPNNEDFTFIGNVSADGILNSDYGEDGLYRLSGADFIYDMSLDFDNELLFSARNGGDYVIHKLDNQGDLITDFGIGGMYTGNFSIPLRSVARIIPTADRGFLHLGSMDDFSDLKSVFQKHNEDGSVDEEIGEIVYDNQPIFPDNMLHADNGDIYITGYSIDGNNPDQLFVIKYKSDITEVENISQHTINISPNPSSIPRWTLSDESIDISEAKLLDISGRYLLELNVEKNQVYSNDKIESGLYILSVITSHGENVNAKVFVTE